MKKISLTLISLFVIIIAVSSCKSKELTAKYGSLPPNEEIQAFVGDTVVIEMTTNASTGYKWDIVYYSNEKVVSFIEDVTIEPEKTEGSEMMVGTSSKIAYKFCAEKEGSTSIVFEYKRANGEVGRQAVYNVTCTKKE